MHSAVPLMFVLADSAGTGSSEVQERVGDVHWTIRYKLAMMCLSC